MKTPYYFLLGISLIFLNACQDYQDEKTLITENAKDEVFVQPEIFIESNGDKESILILKDSTLIFEMEVSTAGRYKVEINGRAKEDAKVWIEDYIHNVDDRSYDITGKISFPANTSFKTFHKDGSPLNVGKHQLKIHAVDHDFELDWIKFTLIQKHQTSKTIHEQKMDGKEWELTWSDEFDEDGLPDSTKWSYNIGNWGWGNNEPQYYTQFKEENARVKNGHLIIEAHQGKDVNDWTSARLSTAGKASFLYGKIEFRAKVPVGRGTWAAGWLLGDEYVDELSWPYCGEIDVLECVGFEIDDETGNGINHATCHTRSYYFKQGNQIGSDTNLTSMNAVFHTYGIEWYPDVIYATLDGQRYYTYDKNKDELEWPFFKPQNIIVNLAVGGGWGGAKGIDEKWKSHQYIIDYIRVYALK